ncbi:MEKHLA domain-containing protein [Paenibacillus sp. yr247]|uniref:MEKHLA domain-containing protein n=1 Tax=Paenibacillus sp. yr247 TaxID=1761880 RepID=UPI0020C8A3A1|nr:MEKHLA domain-containing protein [Paenibacillus sp. yr247]
MNWETFTNTPSRLTAEPMEREERAAFLKAISENGYVDNYTGVRISNTGRRFYIMQATEWNLTDENYNYSWASSYIPRASSYLNIGFGRFVAYSNYG